MSNGPDMQTKPKTNLKRPRTQFRAWLVFELNRRGANLPSQPDWRLIQEAVERHLLRERA